MLVLTYGIKMTIGVQSLVKLALISIDKSQVAWKTIQSLYAEHTKEIQHLLVILDQLQKDLEKEFPTARDFLRPGLD